MRNSIRMLSFPSSHICFFFKKIYVVLIGLRVCFFTERVRVLVKDFKDFNVFCQDYHNLFCFSKTIRVFCLAETINVICSLLFKDYQSLLSCKDYQCHLPFYFFSRLSQSSLVFEDYQSLLQRLSMSPNFVRGLLFDDTNL